MGSIVGAILGGGKKADPAPPAPTPVDAAAEAAKAEQARQVQARASGYSSTKSDDPNAQKKPTVLRKTLGGS